MPHDVECVSKIYSSSPREKLGSGTGAFTLVSHEQISSLFRLFAPLFSSSVREAWKPETPPWGLSLGMRRCLKSSKALQDQCPLEEFI